MLAAVVALAGCDADFTAPMEDVDLGDASGALVISYDQTTTSFETLWPSEMVAGFGKRAPETNELMTSYEIVRETIAYDEDGYLTLESVFTEGHADMMMPADLYEDVKDEMPAPDEDHDPIVRKTIQGSRMTYYGASGNVVFETTIDPERMRLSEQERNASGDTTGATERVATRMREMEAAGVDAQQWGPHHAILALEASPEDAANGVGGYRRVVDLRYGMAIRSAVIDQQGRYEFLTLRTIEPVNGYPVAMHTEHYTFGEINGNWGVTTRTIESRSNVRVQHGVR
jgi:hypothetical protein